MISDGALCIEATGSVTRINAFLVSAGLLSAALVIEDTLRPAGGRGAPVARLTGTHGSPSVGLAAGVSSTWGGTTRVRRYRRSNWS